MSLSLQPVRVATGFDEEGMLVFDGDQRLVAVLTRLSDQNEVAPGPWFLEAGFGRLGGGAIPPLLTSMQHKAGSASGSPIRAEPIWQFRKRLSAKSNQRPGRSGTGTSRKKRFGLPMRR